MGKGRIEAFSDGVIAIIITIMVLEMKPPHSSEWNVLQPLVPVFLSYVLSFIYVGIYWNNHHHFFHAVQHVKGMALWANLHLLFWLSLIPFVTGWMGESHFNTWSVAAYGLVLFLSAVAWMILSGVLIRHHGRESALAQAVGKGFKEWLSLVLYVAGIGLAFVNVWMSCALYCAVAVMWFLPDRRVERVLKA